MSGSDLSLFDYITCSLLADEKYVKWNHDKLQFVPPPPLWLQKTTTNFSYYSADPIAQSITVAVAC